MARCPECGGTRIEQYMMPYGPMWCMDCGFRVEEKMAQPNPFIDTEEDETPAEPPSPPLALGAAMVQLMQAGKDAGGTDPPEAGPSGDRDPDPADD